MAEPEIKKRRILLTSKGEVIPDDPATSASRSGALIGHSEADSKALVPRTLEDKIKGQRVIFVLEKASLELAQLKGRYYLLNCDEHKTLLAKAGREISAFRPDIVHQCLMTLLDSPLNKAGKLLIYIHTEKNVLIEVSPELRIPRTFSRFQGLMIELLTKNKIRASNSNEVLMKVISNPIAKYLPAGGVKVGLSVDGRLVAPKNLVAELEASMTSDVSESNRIPHTVVLGAVAHGDPVSEKKFGADYIEDTVAISNFGLSAACCCSKLCSAFEDHWNIL